MATESMLSMLLAVLLLASGAAAQHEYALLNASYGYIYGPEDNWLDSNSNEKPVTEGNWNELSDSECGEMNQSPIDINTSSLSSIVNSDASPVTSVNFDSDISQNNIQAIKNLGKSVQLDMADDTFTIDRLDGTTQRVIQFHFHWGSEHKINGSRYPMECHFVLSQNSVIGVLFTADSDAAESAADEFISGISAATNANHDSPGNDTGGVLDQLPQRQLFDLFPRTSPAFYYYDGSLTTPPCTEGVEWFVVKDPVPVSQSTIDAFHMKVVNKSENDSTPIETYRGIQALNGRTVYEFDMSNYLSSKGSSLVPLASALVTLLMALLVA